MGLARRLPRFTGFDPNRPLGRLLNALWSQPLWSLLLLCYTLFIGGYLIWIWNIGFQLREGHVLLFSNLLFGRDVVVTFPLFSLMLFGSFFLTMFAAIITPGRRIGVYLLAIYLGLIVWYLVSVQFLRSIPWLIPTVVVVSLIMIFVTILSLEAGLFIFIFASFLEVWGIIPIDVGANLLTLSKVFGAVLLGACLMRYFIGRQRLHSDRRDILLLLLTCLMLASWLWAEDTQRTAAGLNRFLAVLVAYYLLRVAVGTEPSFKALAWGIMLGSLLNACAALLRYAKVSAMIGGAETANTFRTTGLVSDANYLAMSSSIGLTLAIAMFESDKRPWAKGMALVTGIPLVVASILGGSRGGLVGLAFAVVMMAVLRGKLNIKTLVAAMIMIGIGGYAFSRLPTRIVERLMQFDIGSSMVSGSRKDPQASVRGRIEMIKGCTRMFITKPYTGVGMSNFGTSWPRYGMPPEMASVNVIWPAHNIYFEWLAELGIGGISLLLAMMYFGLSSARRAAKYFKSQGNQVMERLSHAALLNQVLMAIYGMLYSVFATKLFWLVLAMGYAMERVAASDRKKEAEAKLASAA